MSDEVEKLRQELADYTAKMARTVMDLDSEVRRLRTILEKPQAAAAPGCEGIMMERYFANPDSLANRVDKQPAVWPIANG